MTWVGEMEARRLVLSLREVLVRHDENVKADVLLRECVPYICEPDPEIARARLDQAAMVEHLSSPEAYARYYRANVHERPFEEQYGIEASEAHEHIPRVAILRGWLAEQEEDLAILDLACNDGWMARNLYGHGRDYHGIDLNPDCVKRARARMAPNARFFEGQVERDARDLAARFGPQGGYGIVVAFEVVEHVIDPDALLATMVDCCQPGGLLFISTPNGATEHGNLPSWWHIEPKGHVRVYTPQSFHALLSRHGEVIDMVLGPDNVLVASVRIGERVDGE